MNPAKLAAILVIAGFVSAPGCVSNHCARPPEPIVCPNCHHHCELEVETVKEARPCFDVECEAICIPPVKLPWHDCCAPPHCAKTRLIHVLVEKEYECERCLYKWKPVCCEACGAKEAEAD